MRRITDYTFVKNGAANKVAFIAEVMNLVRQGYEPLGSPSISTNEFLVQGMVKYAEEKGVSAQSQIQPIHLG